jgi:diadenosine tetraphosphate (Ap4A) HIT family hydrolase
MWPFYWNKTKSLSDLTSIHELAKKCRKDILDIDKEVKGFNFGSNSGEVAGQEIHHFHLIPWLDGGNERASVSPEYEST